MRYLSCLVKFISKLLCDQGPYALFISVGNKDDCPQNKVVETDDAKRFSEQMGVQLFETSAKDNINIEDVSNIYLTVFPFNISIFSTIYLIIDAKIVTYSRFLMRANSLDR